MTDKKITADVLTQLAAVEEQGEELEQQKALLKVEATLYSLLTKVHQLLLAQGEVLDESDPSMRLLKVGGASESLSAKPKKTKDGIQVSVIASATHIHHEHWDDPHDYRWATPPSYPVQDEKLEAKYVPITEQEGGVTVLSHEFTQGYGKRDFEAFAKDLSATIDSLLSSGASVDEDSDEDEDA